MATKTTKQMSLHEMAVRLHEGGEVFIQGYWLKAIAVPEEINPCVECRLELMCRMEMTNLCAECDAYGRCKHMLYPANEKPPIVADITR